jgi:hypothetical protein
MAWITRETQLIPRNEEEGAADYLNKKEYNSMC